MSGLIQVLHRKGDSRASIGMRAYPRQGASEVDIVCKRRPISSISVCRNQPHIADWIERHGAPIRVRFTSTQSLWIVEHSVTLHRPPIMPVELTHAGKPLPKSGTNFLKCPGMASFAFLNSVMNNLLHCLV